MGKAVSEIMRTCGEGARNKNGYKKVGIACIQETHNAEDEAAEIAEYKIYFTIAEKDNATHKGIGGVEITVMGGNQAHTIIKVSK